MESKWPFMLITFGLILALGFTIASIDRTTVMNNWSERRCNLPIMAAGRFFKPEFDPRTPGDFAADNFNFCMGSYVDKFIALSFVPFNLLLSKQTDVTTAATDSVSTMRNIANRLYNTLLSYLDTYFRKFNNSVFEMTRITQYLRMAFHRANAMAIGMVYSGITMFRGILNFIQFVIKVILIICGIMLAIIIILIFVLFPFIPMILAVLGAIIAVVIAISMILVGSIASEADSDRSGFCFSGKTKVLIKREGKNVWIPVSKVKIGDELGKGCGRVTAVIQMDGTDVPLYNLHGVYVSGSHLVQGSDGLWKSVSDDERAHISSKKSSILYCFNTTSHKLPIGSLNGILLFRDWEEIEDCDTLGQYMWNYTVLKMLNKCKNYDTWVRGLKPHSEIPLIGTRIKVKTSSGFVEASKLKLFGSVLDRTGKEQSILGVVQVEVDDIIDKNGLWNTEMYELQKGVWIKGGSTVQKGNSRTCGVTLITESGEFIIWDEMEQKEKIVRDFTEVGYKEIHKTYPMVTSRLRTTAKRLSKV